MRTLNASQALHYATPEARIAAARAIALSLAASDSELIEPELIAWIDRPTAMASPVLEGCGGPVGWHDYGVSHDGCLEIDVDGVDSFIFAESSQYDSYEHFAPGPFRNMRDAQGNEFICNSGGAACVPLDEWTSKLT